MIDVQLNSIGTSCHQKKIYSIYKLLSFFPFQCFQYKTEHAQDVKKFEKLTSQLMRHMASKESN